jgi:hypothetical protein
MLNRCGDLRIDLLRWRHDKDYPTQLVDQLQDFSQQRDTSALILQLQLALLIQQAIRK